jgi:integrase
LNSNQENHINNNKYYNSIRLNDLIGGNNEEWKIETDIEAYFTKISPSKGLTMEDYLNVILNRINRTDFPIVLEPGKATLEEVAIHAIIRQRLSKATVAKRITYARFMETHKIPVDFRKPTFENFVRHTDFREQIENAGYGALGREWDTMKMFLKAYGIPLINWPYKPPSRPAYKVKTIPFPEQVNQFLHLKYSNDTYENALIQYILTHNFVIGWRIPSEPAILKTTDIKIDDQERGYIIITEPKKHNSTRLINPEEIMINRRRKSFKNWLEVWRPKVENQYSNDYVYLKPNGKPFSKESLRMFLNRNAAPLIKQIFPEYHNYIARDFAAISRLIRTKIEFKSFDEFEVKEWLGHTKIQTTMGYIKDAKHYFRLAPYDWINRILKASNSEENSIKSIRRNQKQQKILSFERFFSEKILRTRR